MKLLQNLARVFVDQLQQRLEHEIKEVLAPSPKRKPRKQTSQAPRKAPRQIVQVAPGIEYIPPPKGNIK